MDDLSKIFVKTGTNQHFQDNVQLSLVDSRHILWPLRTMSRKKNSSECMSTDLRMWPIWRRYKLGMSIRETVLFARSWNKIADLVRLNICFLEMLHTVLVFAKPFVLEFEGPFHDAKSYYVSEYMQLSNFLAGGSLSFFHRHPCIGNLMILCPAALANKERDPQNLVEDRSLAIELSCKSRRRIQCFFLQKFSNIYWAPANI